VLLGEKIVANFVADVFVECDNCGERFILDRLNGISGEEFDESVEDFARLEALRTQS
jgi:hypothetical protein